MCLAIPGEVLTIDGDDPLCRTARVSFGGIVKQVSLACTPAVQPGDYVIVHAGIAISVVGEAAAGIAFDYLTEIGALEDAPGASLTANHQPETEG